MKRWILDDGPLGLLARHFNAGWAWPAATLRVLREVAEGAGVDRSGRRQRLLAMSDGSGVPSLLVVDGDERTAEVLYGHMRPSSARATKDLGEDVSVAYCIAQDPEAVFVTMDKRAAYAALAELGMTRVSTPYDLWHWLRNEGHVSQSDWQLLVDATARQDQGLTRVPLRFGGSPRDADLSAGS